MLGVAAQTNGGDKAIIQKHIEEQKAKPIDGGKRHIKMARTYNPVKLILYIPLFIYQGLLSEQVSANCEFEPSCSNFGVLSIKRLGIIKGLFLTADRLTRCNGEAQPEAKNYLMDHHTGKIIDEPEFYKVKN